MAKVAKDTYGNELKVGDEIVFSWGGNLHRANVVHIKLGMRASLTVHPTTQNGSPYLKPKYTGREADEYVTAKVKDSQSVVKI
jgi:hypothetical protein